jgi:hypothetical protein
MSLQMLRRKRGWRISLGGQRHGGWLPEGAAEPLPVPAREVVLDLSIEYDGSGYLLVYSSDDGAVSGDFWLDTLSDAEAAAADLFGISALDWQTATEE